MQGNKEVAKYASGFKKVETKAPLQIRKPRQGDETNAQTTRTENDQQPQPAARVPATSRGSCNRCQQEGHWARDCPEKQDDECHKCNEKGHWARECRNKTYQQRGNYQSAPYRRPAATRAPRQEERGNGDIRTYLSNNWRGGQGGHWQPRPITKRLANKTGNNQHDLYELSDWD